MHLQLRNLLNSGLMGTGRLHGRKSKPPILELGQKLILNRRKQMINTLFGLFADAAVSQDSTFNFLGTLASKEDDRMKYILYVLLLISTMIRRGTVSWRLFQKLLKGSHEQKKVTKVSEDTFVMICLSIQPMSPV